jgi:ribosomal protein S18 acetylase RimI-like enzyme
VGPVPIIGLYVHEQNTRAMKLYENFGFVRLQHVNWVNPRSNKTYYGMSLVLPHNQ